MGLDGLGIDSGKQRIQFLADGDVLNAAVLENLRQHAASGTVHRVDRKLELCLGDEIKIGKPADGLDVCRLEVDFFDRSRLALWASLRRRLLLQSPS